MATWTKIADNWDALTDAEKIALAEQVSDEPTIANLQSISPFRIVNFSGDTDNVTTTLTAVPKDSVVLPSGLIDLLDFISLDKVTLTSTTTGNAQIRLAVSPDLSAYYVYDASSSEWTPIDVSDAATFLANGMTGAQIAVVPTNAWSTLTADNNKIGFAYLLYRTASSELCSTDAITLTVDMRGAWNKAIYGTECTYGYTNDRCLTVNLLTSGSYKINY